MINTFSGPKLRYPTVRQSHFILDIVPAKQDQIEIEVLQEGIIKLNRMDGSVSGTLFGSPKDTTDKPSAMEIGKIINKVRFLSMQGNFMKKSDLFCAH